jgi:hypothetical protein
MARNPALPGLAPPLITTPLRPLTGPLGHSTKERCFDCRRAEVTPKANAGPSMKERRT